MWCQSSSPTQLPSVPVSRPGNSSKHSAFLLVMRKAHMVSVVISYNSAISSSERVRQWQQALGVLAVMCKVVLVFDVITYNAAISS